ncbi:MAG: MATE family efflux transporter, partial [Pseudomonadales bacterium]
SALILGLATLLFGSQAIVGLTNLADVQEAAATYLPYAAAYIVLSFAAFQLDGIFIGTARTRDLRNASLISAVIFLLAWWSLTGEYKNHGLWLAFIIFVVARAVALGWRYPGLRATIR